MAHFWGNGRIWECFNRGNCSHSQRHKMSGTPGEKENGASRNGSRRLNGFFTPRRIAATGCRQFATDVDVPPPGFLSLAAVQPTNEKQMAWECSAAELQSEERLPGVEELAAHEHQLPL